MKKLLPLLFIALSISFNAQTPLPFPNDRVWMILQTNSSTNQQYRYAVENTGETEIDGLLYHTLTSSPDCSGSYQGPAEKYLREAAGIWYIKDDVNSSERVYFNFNLEVGHVYDFNMGTEANHTVTSMGQLIMSDGLVRRVWNLDNGAYRIVEGIGELSSCFEFHPALITHQAHAIVCLKDDEGNLIHLFDNVNPCCNAALVSLPQNARWLSEYEDVYPYLGPLVNVSTGLSENMFDIKGIGYYKIVSGNYCSNSEENASHGYIRAQDSSWYFNSGYSDPEELYFKFNAQVGEVFNDYSWVENDDGLIVEEIDSIQMLDGSMRKRIVLNYINAEYPYYQYWIEGIGSQQTGVRFPTYMGGFWHHNENLRCFLVDDSIVFSNVTTPCCLIVGVEELEKSRIELYPNPASEMLNIKFPYSGKWQVSIYNMHGLLISKEYAKQSGAYDTDLHELPSGMYTIRCQDPNGKLFTDKIIKQ